MMVCVMTVLRFATNRSRARAPQPRPIEASITRLADEPMRSPSRPMGAPPHFFGFGECEGAGIWWGGSNCCWRARESASRLSLSDGGGWSKPEDSMSEKESPPFFFFSLARVLRFCFLLVLGLSLPLFRSIDDHKRDSLSSGASFSIADWLMCTLFPLSHARSPCPLSPLICTIEPPPSLHSPHPLL